MGIFTQPADAEFTIWAVLIGLACIALPAIVILIHDKGSDKK